MKFFFALCAVVAYGETPVRDTVTATPHMYVKQSIHCGAAASWATAIPDASSICIVNPVIPGGTNEATVWTAVKTAIMVESTIKAQFLMRANYAMGGPEVGASAGNCLNLHKGTNTTDNPDFGVGGADAKDASISLLRHATEDRVDVITYAALDCQGTATNTTRGYLWGASSTVGKVVMGGIVSGPVTATTNAGLLGLAAGGTHVVYTSATRWTTKKNFAFQIVGPYTDNKCLALAVATSNINFPLVAPLEDAAHDPSGAAADGNVTTTDAISGEKGITSTVKRCWNINPRSTDGGVGANNDAQLIELSLTTTPGEFKVRYTSGTGAARTAAGVCTAGSNVEDITWKMGYDGTMSSTAQTCIQSNDANGTPLANKFYQLIPAARQIGAWPSSIALPEIAATCPSSPASSLHLSSALIAFATLIAMMM